MKFLRILPETCARTWCLFSSSTRNIAFGSGSITVAITSMASSLEFPESPFFFSSRIGLAIVDRKSTRLNSSHTVISYAVFCLKKKKILEDQDAQSESDTITLQHVRDV